MRYKFTIGRKIGTGFGVVILAIAIVFFLTNKTLTDSLDVQEQDKEVYSPSEDALKDLNLLITQSKMYISNWVHVQSREDHADKDSLRAIINTQYPALRKRTMALSIYWSEDNQQQIEVLFNRCDELFEYHQEIMGELSTFESYDDMGIMLTRSRVDDFDGDVASTTEDVLARIQRNFEVHRNKKLAVNDELTGSFSFLKSLVRYLGIALPIAVFLIAFFTVRSIVKPVQALKKILIGMGRGVLPAEKMKPTNDEIGEMSVALNELVEGFRRTRDFAHKVGSGNFASEYKPLSEDDALGHSLLSMRKDLRELTGNLEQKVKERTEEVVRQKEEIEQQRHTLEELYKDVTDSIRYAKRLQDSILPSDRFMNSCLPNSFVLFKPKDIVSGDFYWVEKTKDKVIFAAVDCTGHGVPGAFMSLVGHNGLDSAVNEHKLTDPGKILDDLSKQTSDVLNKDNEDSRVRDGMDIAICAIDYKKMELQYAGANNPLYLIRDGQLLITKADKVAIGGKGEEEESEPYTTHKIPVQKGDNIYVFSDGYADQFGGVKGKKFMYKHFRNLLLEIKDLPSDEQRDILNKNIEEWRGDLEQIDDILVIGVRV